MIVAKGSLVSGVAFLLVGLWLADMPCMGEVVTMTPGQKCLFLDDSSVAEISGLTRTMHQLQKKGAILPPDVPSDGGRLESYSTPIWDEKEQIYKFVYLALPIHEDALIMEKHNVGEIGMAMALSKDGLKWQKPDLGQGMMVRGSAKNNRIFAVDRTLRWGKNWIHNVIYDPDDSDPTRRYKGLLGSVGRAPIVSPDGITWTKLDVPTIPSSDTSSLMYDRPRRRYAAFVKVGSRFGRAVALSLSDDFETWTKPELCFEADEEDQVLAQEKIRVRLADPGLQQPLWADPDPATGWTPPEGKPHLPTWRAECYQFNVFPYEGVYIGVASMYYPTGNERYLNVNTDGFGGTQLVMSRDLRNWTRLGNRKDFVPPSRIDNGLVGVFDRGQIFVPAPIRMGDELWFYYTGYKSRPPLRSFNLDGSVRDPDTLTPEEWADVKDGWAGICLGALRLDGFVSLDALDGQGYVITKCFTSVGDQLFLNVAAGERGSVRVEVLGEDGEVLPGFARDDAVAISGDGIRQQAVWQTGSYWGLLKNETVQLKIYLEDYASLYAFWTE